MSVFNPFIKQNPDGSWYSKEDYAKLLAENEILKAEVEDWRKANRFKAVRIEAQILARLGDAVAENSRLLAAGDALAYAARHQMAYETELENWRAAKSPTPPFLPQ